jgi:phosphate transport system permease protein
VSASASAGGSLRVRRSRRTILADQIATILLWALGGFVLLVLGLIIVHYLIASWGVLSVNFLLDSPSAALPGQAPVLGGILPFFWDSIYILFLAMLISTPIGVLGGIYMAEYAPENALTGLIRFAEETISSVPSIVVGMFGYVIFGTSLIPWPFHWPFTALSGALSLAVFNLPLMTRLGEQALRAVPQDERAASLALGATKWQGIRHVVLPLAIPGLITGVILTAGRVFGEAAVLLFTAGSTTVAHYNFTNFDITSSISPWSPFHSATTLAVYIYDLKVEPVLAAFPEQLSNGAAAVLIFTVLIFNLAARALGRVLTRKLTAA